MSAEEAFYLLVIGLIVTGVALLVVVGLWLLERPPKPPK